MGAKGFTRAHKGKASYIRLNEGIKQACTAAERNVAVIISAHNDMGCQLHWKRRYGKKIYCHVLCILLIMFMFCLEIS